MSDDTVLLDPAQRVAADPLLGSEIVPNVTLQRKLGAGAFGAVYQAWDRSLERPLAVKLLHPHIIRDAEAVERFFREARILARLSGNPHIPVLFYLGRFQDRPYLVMEFVQGRDLASQIAAQRGLTGRGSGRVSRTYVLDVLAQIAEALADTHEHGIIHRDLKPHNVMVVEQRIWVNGLVKVLDFGVAHSVDPVPAGSGTATGALIGTPVYMAPELFDGEKSSVASDLYALGVLAFELASGGARPVSGDNPFQIARAHWQKQRKRYEEVHPDHNWPPEFLALLDALLERDPARRPASAKEVIVVLKQVDEIIERQKQ